MRLKLWLIRHGMTEGNRYSRYIGTTDEPLCPEGREALEKADYPVPQAVYVSPLARCRETAEILFPGMETCVVEELSECDFGDFENKNYKELSGNPDYQAWIDSGGTLPFPGGESRNQFRERSLCGFQKVISDCVKMNRCDAALVIHGGTIMNLMETYAGESRSFYEWHVKNGGGYLVELDTEAWKDGRCVLQLCETVSAVLGRE